MSKGSIGQKVKSSKGPEGPKFPEGPKGPKGQKVPTFKNSKDLWIKGQLKKIRGQANK